MALVFVSAYGDGTASVANVEAAIADANVGDKVIMPAGTVEWASGVTISKLVDLVGVGIGLTVINMVSSTPDSGEAFLASVANFNRRISGFTLHQDTSSYSASGINLNQPGARGWRIDNVRFENVSRRAILVGPQSGEVPTGCIDHCYFEAPFDLAAQLITLRGSDVAEPPTVNANGAYTTGAGGFGDAEAVFVEDCVFNFGYLNDAAIELYAGANAVVRYNSFYNCAFGVHGRDSTSRSAQFYEFYGNTMTTDLGSGFNQISQIRGGSGVFWGNTMTATGTGAASANQIVLSLYRATQDLIYTAKWLDGSEPTDGNTPDGATASGTHNGGDASATLIDTTKTWTTDEWADGVEGEENQPHFVWNRTDGSGGFVTANTGTVLSATLTGGTNNEWNDGDEYVITFGYPGLDQPGWVGPTTINATYSEQTLAPLYQWDNEFNGSGVDAFPFVVGYTDGIYAGISPRADQFLVEGREFYNDTPLPGYTPYTYPHPLAAGSPPNAPTGLTVTAI